MDMPGLSLSPFHLRICCTGRFQEAWVTLLADCAHLLTPGQHLGVHSSTVPSRLGAETLIIFMAWCSLPTLLKNTGLSFHRSP